MSLDMCYAAMEGDLQSVRSRLVTDERILKFLNLFPADGTMDLLETSLTQNNLQEAFRAAHTLKGLSRDLGLTPLCVVSTDLAEALRPNADGQPSQPEKIESLYAGTRDAYRLVIDAIAIASL